MKRKRYLERLGHTLEDQLNGYKLITDNGCWEWQGSIVRSGYGQMKPLGYKDNKTYRVHRVSYAYYNNIDIDSIADLVIAHKCDNRKCFNPDHLDAVSTHNNSADMLNKKRNKNQYSFTGEDYLFISYAYETLSL